MAPAPHHGPPEPGEQLGPYRVVRLLGSGGMGTVHEAVDDRLGRRVALKVIASGLAADPRLRARFVREARAQASLDSPHVVQVFAHGDADGRLWIASQLVPDGDLGALLRREGPLPPEVAVDLVAQVADGLAEAHRRGLVHRDVKPANVLLRKRGPDTVAYLADFGIAAPVGAGDPLGGTPGYLAPEVAAGAPAGCASDVYSLGCLLRAVLPARAARGELGRVLDRALAADPAARYATAAAFRDALRASGRTTPSRTRRSAVVALAASGMAAAVVTVAGGVGDALGSEARAVDELTTTLGAGGELDRRTAECAARTLVRRHGADRFRGRVDPAVRDEVLGVVAGCLWSR